MDEVLKWVVMTGWPSLPELAGFMYVDRTTVSRKVTELTEQGLVVCRQGGRLVRPRDRFLTATGGLVRVFPQRHLHPELNPRHVHRPLLPDLEDHTHPSFFNGYAGALDLWERLGLIEMWYPEAPRVLQGEGALWTHDRRPRKIKYWRWLRNTRLLHSMAGYEDDYKIFFGHIGRSLTENMLKSRWENRFPDVQDRRRRQLVFTSRGEEEERRRDKLFEPPIPDLDFNPQGSGYVISTPDYRGVELAHAVLPRGNAYLYLVGAPPFERVYTGRAEPAPYDDVADSFEDVDVGIPEDLCRGH